MKELIKLQLRKNAAAYAAIGAALVLTVPLALFIKPAGMRGAEAVSTAMLYWLYAGVPLAAFLFSCSAGAEAAKEQAAQAEQVLPAPQYHVLLSGLAAAALAALITALPVWLVYRSGPAAMAFGDLSLAVGKFYVPGLLFVSLYGFTLAYAFANGIAGAALAAACAGAVLLPLICISIFQNMRFVLIPLAPALALTAILAAAGGAAALKLLSDRADRKKARGAALACAAAGLLAAPVLVSFGTLAWFNGRAASTVMSAQRWQYYQIYNSFFDPQPYGGAVLVQKPLTGEMFLIDKDGRRAVLAKGAQSRKPGFAYLFPDMSYRTVMSIPDGTGKAWILYGQTAVMSRLFHGGAAGLTELQQLRYNTGMGMTEGRRPGIMDLRPDGDYFAPLPPGKKGLAWERLGGSGAGAAFMVKNEADGGRYLNVDKKTRTLRYRGQSWELPSAGAAIPLPLKGGGTGFIVNTGKDKPSYACLPGQQPVEFAPMPVIPETTLYANPDGSFWAAKPGRLLIKKISLFWYSSRETDDAVFYVITSDRKIIKGLDMTPLLNSTDAAGWVKVVHAEGGAAWVNVADKYLARVEDGGRAYKLWALPRSARWGRAPLNGSSVLPSADGVFITAVDGVHFMDWGGKLKKLY